MADLQRTVTRQPQVERRTAKVRLSEIDVLPLSHATRHYAGEVEDIIIGRLAVVP